MTSPRAADDFSAIRARMDELHRERTRALPETAGRSETDLRSSTSSEPEREGRRLPRRIRQRLFG